MTRSRALRGCCIGRSNLKATLRGGFLHWIAALIFNVFRPAGETSWQDAMTGKTLYGWAGLALVKTIEAETPEAAFAAARSVRDPSPILQPVDA